MATKYVMSLKWAKQIWYEADLVKLSVNIKKVIENLK